MYCNKNHEDNWNKMADRERLLDEFSQLTGEPRDRAHFFLEASAWDLEVG